MENQTGISKKELKQVQALRAVRGAKIKVILWVLFVAGVILTLIFGAIFYNRYRATHLPGVAYLDQGREHVGPDHKFDYNSNPPTSGPHFPKPAEWGVYQEALPEGTLIHNLEHGGIWISYRPGIPDDTKKKLEAFYAKYGRKVIVAPRSSGDTDIALAAWGHLDKFSASDYSDERIDRFIKAFRNKGPEYVP